MQKHPILLLLVWLLQGVLLRCISHAHEINLLHIWGAKLNRIALKLEGGRVRGVTIGSFSVGHEHKNWGEESQIKCCSMYPAVTCMTRAQMPAISGENKKENPYKGKGVLNGTKKAG